MTGPRIVYIAGLEHSGTTLLDYILSCRNGVIGLGEVNMMLDDANRVSFFNRWGHYEDATACSCGLNHLKCEIWANTMADIKIRPNRATKARYSDLFSQFSSSDVLVDSSKNLPALDMIAALYREGEISDLRVLYAIKDPRGFVTSVKRAHGLSVRRQFSAFSWWTGFNRKALDHLRAQKIPFLVVPYDRICLDYERTFAKVWSFLSMPPPHANEAGGRSHICMGNKDFVNSKDKTIRYDEKWRSEIFVRLFYRCHAPARRLLKTVHEEANLVFCSK